MSDTPCETQQPSETAKFTVGTRVLIISGSRFTGRTGTIERVESAPFAGQYLVNVDLKGKETMKKTDMIRESDLELVEGNMPSTMVEKIPNGSHVRITAGLRNGRTGVVLRESSESLWGIVSLDATAELPAVDAIVPYEYMQLVESPLEEGATAEPAQIYSTGNEQYITPAAPAVPSGEFKIVPIDRIRIVSNFRTSFDENALAELADSIRQFGIIQPITVRPVGPLFPEEYELVAGERRLRAAKIANLADIPCIVRQLDNREFYEVQIIENLQRRDVPPLDEAHGFLILKEKGWNVAEIAIRIGKSEAHVYQRLLLLELSESWKQLLQKGKLPLVGAIMIAKLSEQQQEELTRLLCSYCDTDADGDPILHFKKIKSSIEHNFLTDLQSASFPKDDATLCPGAGACVACPKRTGFNATLFHDIEKRDMCLDPACFTQKKELYVDRQIALLEAKVGKDGFLMLKDSYYTKREGAQAYQYEPCEEDHPDAIRAVYIDTKDMGKIAWVKLKDAYKGTSDRPLSQADVENKAAAQKAKRKEEIRREKIKTAYHELLADELIQKILSGDSQVQHEAISSLLLKKVGMMYINDSVKEFIQQKFSIDPEVKAKDWNDAEVKVLELYRSIPFETCLHILLALSIRDLIGAYNSAIAPMAQRVGIDIATIEQQAIAMVDAPKMRKKKDKEPGTRVSDSINALEQAEWDKHHQEVDAIFPPVVSEGGEA